MARSPFSRSRAFERIAIPVLLVLFLTVAARQLRQVTSHDDHRHVERVHIHEHRIDHDHEHDRRAERRELRRQHREAIARIEHGDDIEVTVEID